MRVSVTYAGMIQNTASSGADGERVMYKHEPARAALTCARTHTRARAPEVLGSISRKAVGFNETLAPLSSRATVYRPEKGGSCFVSAQVSILAAFCRRDGLSQNASLSHCLRLKAGHVVAATYMCEI